MLNAFLIHQASELLFCDAPDAASGNASSHKIAIIITTLTVHDSTQHTTNEVTALERISVAPLER
jgi:hypothetical protein